MLIWINSSSISSKDEAYVYPKKTKAMVRDVRDIPAVGSVVWKGSEPYSTVIVVLWAVTTLVTKKKLPKNLILQTEKFQNLDEA